MMYSGEHKEPLVSVMEMTIFKGKEQKEEKKEEHNNIMIGFIQLVKEPIDKLVNGEPNLSICMRTIRWQCFESIQIIVSCQ